MITRFPKISIVTPSYNQGNFIEETIQSVISQNYPNLEFIIIDGGSTDNSVKIIKKYDQYLSYWVTEKDNGQANAINKGLQYCTGEIFNWLNSDDYLEQGALQKIAEAFADEQVQMVAGRVRNFSSLNEEVIQNQQLSAEGLMCWEPGVQFVQPGVWMRRKIIEECGGIDEQFHYAFDWDFYIRYLYLAPNVKEISDLIVHFRLHEQSKTQLLRERFLIEERLIIEKISTLGNFSGLKKACTYKILKTRWTVLLSYQSKLQSSFLQKILYVLLQFPKYRKVSFSRQTAGAIKAFWQNRHI